LPSLLLSLTLLAMPALCIAQQAADPGSAVDADWVLHTLARPAPMRTNFLEFRDSPLLKAPLRISGEYQRPDESTLVREVRTPYVETTTLHDGQATIARAGKAPRTFSLSRVPELAGLQASFGAMLSGDRALLERYYRVGIDGTRRQWTMVLTPKQATLAATVRDITLYGRGAELRCIETHPAKGKQVQRTLLAGAAREAGDMATSAPLTALCRGTTP
jgi:hypothetical protein